MSGARKRANGEGSLFPYRNGFAAYIWVTTPMGKKQRKYVYGKTREDVHAKWLELASRARRSPVTTSSPTLGQFIASWLEDEVRPNLAPATHARYESHVRLYIVPGLGNKRLDRLRVADVQHWINTLPRVCQCCAQGKDERRRKRGECRCCALGNCCRDYPSARTISDIRGALRSALSSAMRQELVTRNVAELVKTRKQRPRKVVPWSSDEARRFLESARADGDDLYAAFVLVLVLGMRKGEVLGLAWDAVDLDSAEVRIDLQLQRVGRALLLRETKTAASDAGLPMPDLVVRTLKERKARQAEARLAAGDAWMARDDSPALVFTGKYGMPVDPRTMNRRFDARCAAAGVRRMTVHDARRTCATLLVDLDVHPRVIMRVLRHADLSVTMEVYAKASSNATREALRRLGESLG